MATKEFNISSNAVTVLNETTKAAEGTAKGFTSMKAELRALQNQMLEMDQTSAEFKKASLRAAELKDNISDLSAEINANAGNAFEGLSNNIGLFGSRLMSLDLKGAGTALTAMGTAVGRIDFKTVKEEVGGLVKGFANLAKAILSNPILLLAGVVALVVLNMDKLRKAIPGLDSAMGGLTARMKAAAKANEASLKAKQSEYDIIMASGEIMKEQGMNEKEILLAQQEKAKVLLEQKKITDAQNIANAKADLQRNENLKMVLKGIQEVGLAIPKLMSFVFDAVFAKAKDLLSYVGITIDTSFSAYETIAGAQTMVLDAIFGNTQEEKQAIIEMENQAKLSQTQLANTIAQTNNEIKKSDADLAKSKQKNLDKEVSEKEKASEKEERLRKEANEKELADAKKLAEDTRAIEQAIADDFRAKYKAISDAAMEQAKENEQRLISEKDRELQINKEKYDALIAEADLRGVDTMVFIEGQLAAEAEIKKKYGDKELEDAKKLAEDKLAAEQSLADAKFSLASASVDLLGTIFAKNKKAADIAFALDKALAIASIVVNTQREIAGISSNPTLTAMPDLGASVKIPSIIAAKIRAAVGIASIAGTTIGKFMNGGGGAAADGGGGSAPSAGGGTTAPSPANFAFLGNQPQQQAPLQAYVVGTQVSSNLEAQQLIQNQSRLGG